MKRFLGYIALFLLPFAGFIWYILSVDLPRKCAYLYTRNEGCNIEWIYRRIFEQERKIDIAFIGTSHTGCGIDDFLLDSLIPDQHSVNLAYCQGGRSVQYAVLKDLLSKHQPKTVVLEVRMEEDPTSHRDFGLVGEIQDVLHAPFIVHRRYTGDLVKAFQVRYMYFQDRMMNLLPEGELRGKFPSHSFMEIFRDTADPLELQDHAKRETLKLQRDIHSWLYEFHMEYPLGYLSKMKALADEHRCKLIFLYLPSFGMVSPKPFQSDFYEKNGNLLIPESQLFQDPNMWYDSEHLNTVGAKKLSRWLVQQLKVES